jgi:zona occludens toxin
MIYLITGVPGAGKTLYALNFVKALAEKDKRQVFYSGIRDCILPWTDLDPEFVKGERRPGAEKWYELPASSMVVIDECQEVFRPRGQGAKVPAWVAELETHRHKGLDIFLITQHPMLMDSNVRRLVGIHFHVVRAFGMHRSTVHEFQGAKENCDKSRADSIRHDFKYPVESFGWYKSAEVHTHKRRIPMRLLFFVLIPFLLAALSYGLYSKMWKYASGSGAADRITGKAAPDKGAGVAPGASHPGGAGGRKLSVAEWFEDFQPRISSLAFTAPRYDEVMRPVRVPFPAACVKSGSRCSCYTDQATKIQVAAEICLEIVANGYFQDFDQGKPVQSSELRREPVQVVQGRAGLQEPVVERPRQNLDPILPTATPTSWVGSPPP